MPKLVIVDNPTCIKTASIIRELKLRNDFYQRPFLTIPVEAETRLRANFYAVAICHQTYDLQHPGLGLFGWDYLEYVFTGLMKEGHGILTPGFAQKAGPEMIAVKLAGLFSPDGLPENTTLDRLEERAKFLVELDSFIAETFDSKLENLVRSADNRLFNNGSGYYEILPGLTSFSDPMKKKITFLLKLLEESGMVNIQDKQHYVPIMDYHMQRVLLRTGCVEINDPVLHQKLTNHIPLESDEEIRSACIDAFRIVADVSGHPITKLNDFFWSLGRSCCNSEPLCQYHRCEKNPCTFFEIVELAEHKDCTFRDLCKGYRDEKYRELWQPVVETHYY